MASLYVLGGKQRDLMFRHEEEWNLYESALILQVDTESGASRTCIEYKSPPQVRASDTSSVLFKSGSLVANTLYTCTSTEVLVFRLPDFERIGYVSLPCFNDLHHVCPASDGNLLAAVTGLDMVVKFTAKGEVISEWSALPEPPRSRFSRSTDYRKVESTKPHQSHPNFVFELEGKPWVTRFNQRDAICLDQPRRKIRISVERPHDGFVCGAKIYFTSVDGRVIIANRETLLVEKVIDLKEIDGEKALLGWCRGLLPVDGRKVWVGFTRIRKTRFHENVLWVKHAVREAMREKPTHIALYDIEDMCCLQEIDLEELGMNIVFSIFPAARVATHDRLTVGSAGKIGNQVYS